MAILLPADATALVDGFIARWRLCVARSNPKQGPRV